MESQWLFYGVFHSIAENPALLQLVDLLNIIGLLLVGTGLLLGLFTRVSSAAGAILILLFYIANSPFIGYLSETTGEGHYLVVNKQLIEMAVLVLFVFLPRDFFLGLDRWISRSSNKVESRREDKEKARETSVERRELLKDLIVLPFIGGLAWVVWKKKK